MEKMSMYEDNKTRLPQLIAEYERLRKLSHELDVQANIVDQRLNEIERLLPDQYTFPGDALWQDGKR